MTQALILIVEDNEKNRKLVRDVLQFKGYQTVETETGEDGIKLAQKLLPALIIMDIRLPGMDGIDAFKFLRNNAKTKGIPVIAVTASAMPEDQLKVREAGFDGYHSKPIRVKEFLGTVEDVLNRSGNITRGDR